MSSSASPREKVSENWQVVQSWSSDSFLYLEMKGGGAPGQHINAGSTVAALARGTARNTARQLRAHLRRVECRDLPVQHHGKHADCQLEAAISFTEQHDHAGEENLCSIVTQHRRTERAL